MCNPDFPRSESSTMQLRKSLQAGLCLIIALLTIPASAALPEAFQIDESTPIDFKMDRIQILKIEEAGQKISPAEALQKLERSGEIATMKPWRARNKIYWQYLRIKNTNVENFLLRIYWQGFDRPDIYVQRPDGGLSTLQFRNLYSYNLLAGADAEKEGVATMESRYMTVSLHPDESIGVLARIKDNEYLGAALGLGDHAKLLEWDRFYLYFDGFFLGGIIFMAIYALLIALKSRSPKELLYAVMLLFFAFLLSLTSSQPIDGSALFEFWISDNFEHIWFAKYLGGWATVFSFYLYLVFCYVMLESESFRAKNKWARILRSLAKTVFFLGLIILCVNVWVVYSVSMRPDLWGDVDSALINLRGTISSATSAMPFFIVYFLEIFLTIDAIRAYRSNVNGSGAILCILVFVLANQIDLNLLNFLPTIFRVPFSFCIAGLLMAYSTISKNKQTQDALTDAMKTRQAFIEEQNRLLEDRVVQRTAELQAQTEKT
jgi:hypothetical protein